METLSTLLLWLSMFGLGFYKYTELKERQKQDKVLLRNWQAILEDLENACHRVGKELSIPITLSQEFTQQIGQSSANSAFLMRFAFLVKEELDGEDLSYLTKNLEIALKKLVDQNYRTYSSKHERLMVRWRFSNRIVRRNGLNYLDLEMLFYYDEEGLQGLQQHA